MVGVILWALIGGTIIGVLGRMFAPGKNKIGFWLTILCGIGGMLLGTWLYGLFFDVETRGVDWWRHVWQVVVAAVLVVAVTRLTGSRRGVVRR